MKKLTLFLLTLTSLIFGHAQSHAGAERLLSDATQAETFAGVTAGVAVGDEIKWIATSGYCDEDLRLACNDSTLFRTASIAKTITAVAALQLYEKGQLDLDLAIRHYLPGYPAAAASTITARQLLHHTTGIGGYASAKEAETKDNCPDLAAAVKVFQDRPLDFAPGTKYQYTTYGYVLLGRVIEVASGQTYEDYIQENIFKPAGMLRTSIEKFEENYANKSAFFYRNKRDKIKVGTPNNLSNRIPGGGFQSTAGDMLRFGQALLNHTLLQDSTFALMQTCPDVDRGENNLYGMGIFLYGDNPTYGPVMGHSGEQTGAAGQLMLLPEKQAVIIVLSNTSGAWRDAFQMTVNLFQLIE